MEDDPSLFFSAEADGEAQVAMMTIIIIIIIIIIIMTWPGLV